VTDPADKDRLAALDKRIRQLKREDTPGPKMDSHFSQAHLAWRMVTELVTGIIVGFGIGYGLDALFGTLPIFLVLFVLLGFAAGVRVMMRTAGEVQKEAMAQAADEDGRD